MRRKGSRQRLSRRVSPVADVRVFAALQKPLKRATIFVLYCWCLPVKDHEQPKVASDRQIIGPQATVLSSITRLAVIGGSHHGDMFWGPRAGYSEMSTGLVIARITWQWRPRRRTCSASTTGSKGCLCLLALVLFYHARLGPSKAIHAEETTV